MSCNETVRRLAELSAIKRLVLKEKNSKNSVAALLFFPAINGNQQNVETTIAAVNVRKKVLTDIYQSNQCVNNIPAYSTEKIKQMINAGEVRELQL